MQQKRTRLPNRDRKTRLLEKNEQGARPLIQVVLAQDRPEELQPHGNVTEREGLERYGFGVRHLQLRELGELAQIAGLRTTQFFEIRHQGDKQVEVCEACVLHDNLIGCLFSEHKAP